MKIFNSPTSAQPVKSENSKAAKVAKGPTSRKKAPPPERKQMSADEIKSKLAAHVEGAAGPKKKPLDSQKLGDGFLNEAVVRPPVIVPFEKESAVEATEEEIEKKKDIILKSDIAKNDPTDTNTQEKLKSVLAKGAFSFSAKEKEALERILA